MTLPEDFKRFEKFLDGMEDTEYDYWYDNEASEKQKALADTIREEIEEEDVGHEYRDRSELIKLLTKWLDST